MKTGIVYTLLQEYEQALLHYEQAVTAAQTSGNKMAEGAAFGNIGNVYIEQGNYELAIWNFKQSLQISRGMGNKHNEGVSLGNLGNVYGEIQDYDQALLYYHQSLEISREIGYKRGEGMQLGNIGNVYVRQGQYEDAIQHYEQSIMIAESIGNTQGLADNYANLAGTFTKLKRWEEAEANLIKSIDIFRGIVPSIAGVNLGLLAWVKLHTANQSEARKCLQEGSTIVPEGTFDHGKLLCFKSKVLHAMNELQLALEVFEQAKETAKSLKTTEDSDLGVLIKETEEFLRSKGEG